MPQSETPVQLTPVPPKPTCHLLFSTGPCSDMWRNYNQALQQHNLQLAQLYVNRQKELAASQATAPLQHQIADLNQLVTEQRARIEKLNDQIQADTTAALQAQSADASALVQTKSVAHTRGLQQGAGIGVAVSLVLYGVIVGVRKLVGRTGIDRPPTRAASAAS